MPPFDCSFCKTSFAQKKNLYQHVRNFHRNESTGLEKRMVKTICPDCKSEMRTMKNLLNHVSENHQVTTDTFEMTFINDTDFKLWLKNEEEKGECKFACRRSSQGEKLFLCHRSGFEPSIVEIENRKRQRKQGGSCKINGTCTSYITSKEVCGKINVFYCSTHFGHQRDPGFLPIRKEDKDILAGKLLQGVSVKRVLKDVRAQEQGEKIQRLHLTNRQDIKNICSQYGISPSSSLNLHSEDITSVEAWVAAEKHVGGKALFYKAEGNPYENLEDDDFILVIQTAHQKKAFLDFGEDRICIDSTHGTTGYDFNLTSIFVVDDLEQGLPVAFCISTRVNHQTMSVFFNAVKETSRSMICNAFMSDDAPVFKNAWIEVMGLPKRILLCTWQVDRAWQGRLKKVKNEEVRKEVYRQLKVVAQELKTDHFEVMFNSFLEKLVKDEETKDFGEYLSSHYSNRREQWAYAYRVHCKLNVNMYLEAFHKTFKYLYQGGKQNKRVDKCIAALLEYMDDREQDKVNRLLRGKSTKKTAAILPRHKQGIDLKAFVEDCTKKIWVAKDGQAVKVWHEEWQITSRTRKDVTYVIERGEHTSCDKKCGLWCQECGVCNKAFICTCPDNAIKGHICKHIHAVSLHKPKQAYNTNTVPEPTVVEEQVNSEIVQEDCKKRSTVVMDRFKVLEKSLNQGKNYSKEIEDGVLYHMNAAIKLLNLTSVPGTSLPKMQVGPRNKNIVKQKRFVSVRKKTKKTLMKKASASEAVVSKDLILMGEAVDVSVGAISFEHNYNN